MNYWIYQGNPKTYDIDSYIATHPYIYWYSPKHIEEVQLGDTAFLWRTGVNAGLIAIGKIVEKPTPLKLIKHPELLGNDFWTADNSISDPDELKVGIEIIETRLSEDDGMLTRNDLKSDPVINNHRIITNPTGTIFKLEKNRSEHLLELWGNGIKGDYFSITPPIEDIVEGEKKQAMHYRYERSSALRQLKINEFKKCHDTLFCELCDWNFEDHYPEKLAKDFMEVHHKIPLFKLEERMPAKLDDLMLVCSNCHRMIHRTKQAEDNLELLNKWFKKA
jgi:hypothetical protein